MTTKVDVPKKMTVVLHSSKDEKNKDKQYLTNLSEGKVTNMKTSKSSVATLSKVTDAWGNTALYVVAKKPELQFYLSKSSSKRIK